MKVFPGTPVRCRRSLGWVARSQRGLTLVEIMVSLGILVLTSVGGVSAFLLLNRYASNERNLSAAKALCQERIEQAQTLAYAPTSKTPAVGGQTVNAAATGPFSLLGVAYASGNTASNYDVNGLFTGGSALQTSTEPVNVYLKQESGTNVVVGTRTTTVGLPTTLTDFTAAGSPQLKLVKFTVTVTYTYRSQNFSYSMYTFRSVD